MNLFIYINSDDNCNVPNEKTLLVEFLLETHFIWKYLRFK